MRRSAAPSFKNGGPGKRIKFSSPMLSNSKKSSPIQLPLRELKDAEVYLNAPTCDKENRETKKQQSSQPIPVTKFQAPIVKTTEVINHTKNLKPSSRSTPSVSLVKKFAPSFKSEPLTIKNTDSCSSSETKRFYKAMFTK